ncbi:MAG: O-antigen ligase family protein [Acidobacteriota bacterium]
MRRFRRARPAWTLVAFAAWTLFAFAGAYLWTTLPLVAAAILLVFVVRPPIARPPQRILDQALAACLLVVALQLLPLPPGLRLALSPHVGILDQALWVGAPSDPQNGPASPLSIDVAATRVALALAVAFVCVFWSAREIVAHGGVRTVSRGIAWTGLALAAVTLAQRATAPTRIYWSFPTVFGAPFGPYRNRNDFATWLIMAIPATVGYIAARTEARKTDRGHSVPFAALVDADAVWFAGSVSLMSAALLASLSRSGLMGAGASLLSFLWLSRSRVGRGGRLRVLASVVLVLAMALTYVQAGALTERLDETLAAGVGGRQAIWQETWGMARDFPMVGIGAGAYGRGMLVYQQTRNGFHFNQAHDEYLQLAAEGGWLLAVPVLLALVSGAWQIMNRLRADRTPVFWIRAGAASGLVAVAIQSVWDTGLRMPANAVLFALLAGVALHDSEHNRLVREGDGRRGDRAPSGKARATSWTWSKDPGGN